MRRELSPTTALPTWMALNGVQTNGVQIQDLDPKSSRGVVATAEAEDEGHLFVDVPSSLVLSVDTAWAHAKHDRHLREVLEANGEFAKSPRGAILIFLLVQICMSSPDLPEKIGVTSPWSEYIKFIHAETSLPTFWAEAERECLWGTSLEQHLAAKLKALDREFADFRRATESIGWCRHWWDPETGCLSIDDWKTVDSIHRSRSMDFSQHGLCLVPVMDMANHDNLAAYKALYKIEPNTRDAQLTLEWRQSVEPGEEVTIMYGFERGAADSIFSYGFIEPGAQHAQSLYLAMDSPPDDPLAFAKMAALDLKPGLKVSMQQSADRATWVSGFVWAMCINEEDGLEIKAAQTVDGHRELEVLWKGSKIANQFELEVALKGAWLQDLFKLRAFSMVHARVEEEIGAREKLQERPEEEKIPDGVDKSSPVWKLAEELRDLEMALLRKAAVDFYETIVHLSEQEEVRRWLNARAAVDNGEDYDPYAKSAPSDLSFNGDSQWNTAVPEVAPETGAEVNEAADVEYCEPPLPRWGIEVDDGEKEMRRLALSESLQVSEEDARAFH